MSHPMGSLPAMELDDLYRVADTMGVTITDGPATMPVRGYYHHHTHTIVLHPHLAGRALVSTLAHELGHAHHGHTPTDDEWLHARHEHQADAWAARALIDEEAYRRAEAAYDGATGPIAYELGVTPRIVEVFRRMHEKRDALP